MSDLLVGADGLARCGWAGRDDPAAGPGPPKLTLYQAYHDQEWGVPLRGDRVLFERMCLEAFQSGLSWLTILRKRENFRRAFAEFSIATVAGYDEHDVQRLLADAGIVRHRAKIMAAITNARAAAELPEGLSDLLWSFQPPDAATRPVATRLAELPGRMPESDAMAKELKRRGFVFVGPTTAYSLMQAVGMVNDHLAGCHTRAVT